MKDLKEQKSSPSVHKRYYSIKEVRDQLNKIGIDYFNKFIKTTIPENTRVISENIVHNNLRRFLLIENSTIRFWENHFHIKPKKRIRGNRAYTYNDITLLIQLYNYLKIEGMSIDILKMKIIMNEIQFKKTKEAD